MNAHASVSETLDVLIIGAGLSGIGAAVHLQKDCPNKSFAILESRAALGGTWDLFRYPGIRSDSDMYTLGYNFKPWTNPKAIADGSDIRDYIYETATEYGIDRKIRYRHKVLSLDWSSQKARWTLQVQKTDTNEIISLQSRFIISCTGYYNYENGFTPDFEDRKMFKGTIIHPQHWPEDLDYSGKRVVIIGSGATAVTLVPAMADKAMHVTMLQRSPGYVASVPGEGILPNTLRKFLPERTVYGITRTGNMLLGLGFYNASRAWPEQVGKFLREQVQKQLGPNADMQHFTPRYKVWDERLCAVPDGDLFKALKSGRASVVTDHIERFTKDGILLKSGTTLEADIIITATGLSLQFLGGAQISLDNQPVNIPSKRYYKGAMLEDVPNLALVFGYTNSSWTLKADLISEYCCRVLNHMDENGFAQCTPRYSPRREGEESITEPFLNLSAGYVQRVISTLPRQGSHEPWKLYQNYLRDYALLKLGRVHDKVLVFSNPVSHCYGYGYALDEQMAASVANAVPAAVLSLAPKSVQ